MWPGSRPAETADIGAENTLESKPNKSPCSRVTKAEQADDFVFRPAKDKDTGRCGDHAPGGYNILAWDLEGGEVATWLNSIGVTGIVLKYRGPRRPDDPKDKPPIRALQDAQRAMSLVRSKAAELNVDPKRLGMLGFSAGGHLTAATATNFDKRSYDAIDDVDKASCRPDFVVLIYPAYLVEKDKTELKPDIRVGKDSPPTFFAHAGNDGVSPVNSVAMYLALKKVGVPAELHVYSTGGHGFGLRPSADACSTWPQRCAEWMKAQGIVKAMKS